MDLLPEAVARVSCAEAVIDPARLTVYFITHFLQQCSSTLYVDKIYTEDRKRQISLPPLRTHAMLFAWSNRWFLLHTLKKDSLHHVLRVHSARPLLFLVGENSTAKDALHCALSAAAPCACLYMFPLHKGSECLLVVTKRSLHLISWKEILGDLPTACQHQNYIIRLVTRFKILGLGFQLWSSSNRITQMMLMVHTDGRRLWVWIYNL